MSKSKRRRTVQQQNRTPNTVQTYLARASRAGIGDLRQRVPELRSLSDLAVAQFGVGSLGAPTALEFCRSGVGELRIIDSDFVDAGNVVRWPLGFSMVGIPKVEAIRGFAEANYPYTVVRDYQARIGAPRLVDREVRSELDLLTEVLEDVDLIYDATAEPGVWYALSELAREIGVPYVLSWATAGAWGGVVARVRPTGSGCWLCLEHHFDDGSIPNPPADPVGAIQPPGCADPTFAGASFDLGSVALAGVRLAVSTLCEGSDDAYPACPWDVAVISLRDDTGHLADGAQTFELSVHPDCSRCAA